MAREAGVSKQTIYDWKAKYGRMGVSQALEAKQLRDENMRLQKLVAVLRLEAGFEARDLALEMGVSEKTLYNWKAKYLRRASEAKRLRDVTTSCRSWVRI